MATVRLAGITKRFEPATVAVDDLTLDVADGELMVLLGPSGCGKSTVLRLIGGLERADAGSISIGGRVVDDVDARDRDVAMVFQSYALYPHMTVRRNIGFPLKPLGVARRERDREAERVADLLGIADVLDRKPGQLSGGQQQRVAVARALVRRPLLFLMDEPLSNLDAQLRTETRAELVRLQRELGTTVIYVTHDQVEALTMADRIAVVADGRVQQVGTPEEIYDRPANVFVAGFVGAPPINLWPATIDADHTVRVDGVELAANSAGSTRSEGSSVTVGVRPESVRLVTVDEPGIAATVGWVEDLGHEHVVGGALAAGAPFAVRWPGERKPPGRGDEVRVCPDPAHLHWFDPSTGKRIPWP